jgi:hypothetical protein
MAKAASDSPIRPFGRSGERVSICRRGERPARRLSRVSSKDQGQRAEAEDRPRRSSNAQHR